MHKNSMRTAGALFLGLLLLTAGSAEALLGNRAPVSGTEGAPVAKELALATYREIPIQGQFLSSAPAEETVTYQVAQQPKKGTVETDGAAFTYTPGKGKTGTDRFTYTVSDSAGHQSAPAAVTVVIHKIKSGVAYADTDVKTAAAAQDLAERGIFTGARIGESFYFEPDRTVSRGEFLAMTLETVGTDVTAVTLTGFCDDEAIPAWAKAYASAGVRQGIVQGERTEAGVALQSDAPITLREAAVMLNRALDVSDVDLETWYGDRETVPSWAAQAVGNLESTQILAAGSFGSDTLNAAATRGDAAKMLSAAASLLETRKGG